MTGVKRAREEANTDGAESDVVNGLGQMFLGLRGTLEAHHDRRERIVKVSRDITVNSKKAIFALQRCQTLGPNALTDAIRVEVDARLEQIAVLLNSVAHEVSGSNSWRYHRQLSPGIQEFIEAISFKHYLETQTLITFDQVQQVLNRPTPSPVDQTGDSVMNTLQTPLELTMSDYLLGLGDLSGEMMRWAITAIARKGRVPCVNLDPEGQPVEDGTALRPEARRDMLMDMRSLRTLFEGLQGLTDDSSRKELKKKLEVMCQSVEKVETAVYGIIVRGSERPSGWMPDARADERMPEEVRVWN